MAKQNYYFPTTLDAVIERFNKSEDQAERNRIWNNELHTPFCKLVEIIINRFKFSHVLEYHGFESLHAMCLEYAVRQMNHYKPTSGKAFGYFSLIIKNFLIQQNIKHYNNNLRNESADTLDEDTYGVHQMMPEALTVRQKDFDLKEFGLLFGEWCRKNKDKYFDNPHTKKCVDVFCQMMIDPIDLQYESMHNHSNPLHCRRGKGSVFNYLKATTGISSTPKIGKAIKTLESYYNAVKKNYINTGEVELIQIPEPLQPKQYTYKYPYKTRKTYERKKPTPSKKPRVTSPDGTKWLCRICKEFVPINDFYVSNRWTCRHCIIQRVQNKHAEKQEEILKKG